MLRRASSTIFTAVLVLFVLFYLRHSARPCADGPARVALATNSGAVAQPSTRSRALSQAMASYRCVSRPTVVRRIRTCNSFPAERATHFS